MTCPDCGAPLDGVFLCLVCERRQQAVLRCQAHFDDGWVMPSPFAWAMTPGPPTALFNYQDLEQDVIHWGVLEEAGLAAIDHEPNRISIVSFL